MAPVVNLVRFLQAGIQTRQQLATGCCENVQDVLVKTACGPADGFWLAKLKQGIKLLMILREISHLRKE